MVIRRESLPGTDPMVSPGEYDGGLVWAIASHSSKVTAAGALGVLSDGRKWEITRPDHRWQRDPSISRTYGGGFGGGGGDDLDLDDGYSPTGAPTSLVIVKGTARRDE